MDIQTGSDDRNFDAALQREMEYLLASEMFRKSPRLSQLLAYLVGATLRGEGETLKSYTVAVDGLGRSPDFDAQADSYPRVQVMRLRNFLASFYARYEPVGDLCIYLLPGSYRVRLAKFAIAYPDIVTRSGRRRLNDEMPYPTASAQVADDRSGSTPLPQPDGDEVQRPASTAPSNAAPAAEPRIGPFRQLRLPEIARWQAISLGITAAFAILLILFAPGNFILHGESGPKPDPAQVPTILISDLASPRDLASRELAVEIHHALENGIAQSWVVDPLGSLEGGTATHPDYRLDASLARSGDAGHILLAELVARSDGRIIWSKRLPIQPSVPIPDQLDSLLAQIASPLGVIGKRQFRLAKGRELNGVTCLLAAHSLVSEQNYALRIPVKRCLQHPFANERLEAVRLANLAQLTVQDSILAVRPIPFAKAEGLARRAIDSDDGEVSGYSVMAWLKYIRGQCDAGNGYAANALALNSFEPSMLTFLANFAVECGSSDGARLVQKAFGVRDAGSAVSRLAIVQLALKNDRLDVLATIGGAKPSELNAKDPAFLLSEAILAAYTGDIGSARQRWQSFVALRNRPGATPEALLDDIVFSKTGRAKTIEYLRTTGVIGASA